MPRMKFSTPRLIALTITCTLVIVAHPASPQAPPAHPIVLHAARLLDVSTGHILAPGEILIDGTTIKEVSASVSRPPNAEVLDLGDSTLLPGLIDAHVHLFLHPGAEDLQTVEESVPERTITATLAAHADLMAGFTAERDMGTEGAGSADTAVRNAINRGEIPGPRMRISGNAIDILGGHEDANSFNPAQHVLSNATYANPSTNSSPPSAASSKKAPTSSRFTRPARTKCSTAASSRPTSIPKSNSPPPFTKPQRVGSRVAVHATGEPGTGYAARAGVASVDHAYQLSDDTMRLMHEKQIFAVPTFAIAEYFAAHAATPEAAARENAEIEIHAAEFKKQLAAGVPIAMGSDVGPFPHGTQAREFELMVKFGMSPLAAIQAGTINAAKLLDWPAPNRPTQARLLRRHRRRPRQPSHRHLRAHPRHLRHEKWRHV